MSVSGLVIRFAMVVFLISRNLVLESGASVPHFSAPTHE